MVKDHLQLESLLSPALAGSLVLIQSSVCRVSSPVVVVWSHSHVMLEYMSLTTALYPICVILPSHYNHVPVPLYSFVPSPYRLTFMLGQDGLGMRLVPPHCGLQPPTTLLYELWEHCL